MILLCYKSGTKVGINYDKTPFLSRTRKKLRQTKTLLRQTEIFLRQTKTGSIFFVLFLCAWLLNFMNTVFYFAFTLGGYFLFVLTAGLWIYYNRSVLFLFRNRKKKYCNQQAIPSGNSQHSTLNSQQQSVPKHAPSLLKGNMKQQLLVYRLNDYILDNLTDSVVALDRDKLVSALSTNRTTLSKSVRDVTGKTLMEYINLLRLEKTVKILDIPSGLTLEAIAETYGFTYRKFYRYFTEHFHCKPSEYRKMASCSSATHSQTANM